jgi:Leucine-rich repeat (LRR) protein
MGNCIEKLSSPSQQERRLSGWKSTGVVGLRDAKLRSIPDAALGLGDAVRVVDASHNNIRELSPSLAGLTNLQRLVLAHNAITCYPASLCTFPLLKILVLDGNELQELDQEICMLARLEKLSLAQNRLRALPASLGQLKDLKSLSAQGNQLSSLPHELGGCGSLQELELHGNAIGSIPSSLGQLAKLRTLNLDNNQVRGCWVVVPFCVCVWWGGGACATPPAPAAPAAPAGARRCSSSQMRG